MKTIKNCPICANNFSTTRNHAKTCSARCRFILHKLNRNYIEFSSSLDYLLFHLSIKEIRQKNELMHKGGDSNSSIDHMEFVDGYKDINGKLKILIFRKRTPKYLKIWNYTGDRIIIKIFKYN